MTNPFMGLGKAIITGPHANVDPTTGEIDWKTRALKAEARVKYLESLMGGRASTINLSAKL